MRILSQSLHVLLPHFLNFLFGIDLLLILLCELLDETIHIFLKSHLLDLVGIELLRVKLLKLEI